MAVCGGKALSDAFIQTFAGAFFGAVLAFTFDLLIIYFKKRRFLKFNIAKTQHIMQLYRGLVQSEIAEVEKYLEN